MEHAVAAVRTPVSPVEADVSALGHRTMVSPTAFVATEDFGSFVVSHELADSNSVRDQRDEGERSYVLVPDDFLDPIRLVSVINVRHEDGLRLAMAGLPRCVAGKVAPVFLRQPPRSHELHDSRVIEQQDRGAPAAHHLDDRVEGGIMDILVRPGPV